MPVPVPVLVPFPVPAPVPVPVPAPVPVPVPADVLVSVKVLVTTDDASAEPSGMESIPESLHPTNASPIPIEAGTTTCLTVSLRKFWMRSRMSFSFMVGSYACASRYRSNICDCRANGNHYATPFKLRLHSRCRARNSTILLRSSRCN